MKTIYNIIKRTPLKTIVARYAQYRSMRGGWKSLPAVYVKNARETIDKIHARPEGHVLWDNPSKESYDYDLSIIVPFYKTEQYAKRCIDSILNQKTQYSFEVLLVDDGSPDNCGAILDLYTDRADVKVLHKKNGGLSDARNYGIKNASGEYIFFCDSDDYLPENALEPLLRKAKEYDADIVEGAFITFDDFNRRTEYKHNFEVLKNGQKMFGYACGKVYKSKLFEKVCFPVGYWFEDTIIAGLILPRANVTIVIPQVVYNYYINRSGITHQASSSPRSIDTYYIFEELYDAYKNAGIPVTSTIQNALIWQLSEYVYSRCKNIGEENMKSLFILCAKLAERYGILEKEKVEKQSFWAKEVCEAFVNIQYERWKLAAQMI